MPQKKTVRRECKVCKRIFFVRPVDAARMPCACCSRSCASKIRPRGDVRGEKNPAWKGGRTKSKKGYWYIKMPGHHQALKNGYVKLADVVLEKKLGRRLLANEIAHHKNEIKDDDSPSNLEPMRQGPHVRLHAALRMQRSGHVPKQRQPDHPVNRRYVWPSDAELLLLRQTMTLRAIAAKIGCNFKVVDRRIRRILQKQ
jgi:hypothetical protein